jgi:hypothetical protein
LPGPTRRCRRGGQKYRARSDIDEKGYDEKGHLLVPPRSIPTRRWHEEEVLTNKEATTRRWGQAREIHWLTMIEKGTRVVAEYSRGIACRWRVLFVVATALFPLSSFFCFGAKKWCTTSFYYRN